MKPVTRLGRICKKCEKRFIPGGKAQKQCDDCRDMAHNKRVHLGIGKKYKRVLL